MNNCNASIPDLVKEANVTNAAIDHCSNATTASAAANATAEFGVDVLSDSTPMKLLLVAAYSIIFTVGTSGNAVVLACVAKNKNLQSPTNVFIANLALSDVLMCLLAVPFTPLNGMISSWVLGEPLCRMVAMSSALCVHVSAQTSTAIAVDRYFAIVHPFKARLTTRQCLFVIGPVWLLSLAFSLPLALYQQVAWDGEAGAYTCDENWPDIKWVRIFTFSSLGLQYLVPCSVISVCYSRVYAALNRRSRNKRHLRQRRNVSFDRSTAAAAAIKEGVAVTVPLNGSLRNTNLHVPASAAADVKSNDVDDCRNNKKDNNKNNKKKNRKRSVATASTTGAAATAASKENQELRRKRRTTNMLIAMVAIFVGCWLPLNVIMLTFDYAEDSLKFWPYRMLTFFIAHVIAMSSTVYNPFLYAWLNEAFREEFRKLLPPFLFSCLTCSGCFSGCLPGCLSGCWKRKRTTTTTGKVAVGLDAAGKVDLNKQTSAAFPLQRKAQEKEVDGQAVVPIVVSFPATDATGSDVEATGDHVQEKGRGQEKEKEKETGRGGGGSGSIQHISRPEAEVPNESATSDGSAACSGCGGGSGGGCRVGDRFTGSGVVFSNFELTGYKDETG